MPHLEQLKAAIDQDQTVELELPAGWRTVPTTIHVYRSPSTSAYMCFFDSSEASEAEPRNEPCATWEQVRKQLGDHAKSNSWRLLYKEEATI